MYTKQWYKQEYQKYKRRNAWMHACCRSQALELKKLRKRIQELEHQIRELKSVLHVASAAMEIGKEKE